MSPPKGEPWVWHSHELVCSPAWRLRSIHCVRLIDFLEVEHMHHAGTENGNLIATYDQLEAWGIGRQYIKRAIEEAVFLGLVRHIPGGRWVNVNFPSRFGLTYYGDYEGSSATNPWKKRDEEQIKERRSKRKGFPNAKN